MSNPEPQRDLLDAEYLLKAAQADYANLRVQIDSELMTQKANEAAVRSDYEQAHLQHDVDEKLQKEGIGAEVIAKLSKVKEDQLGIRLKLESERAAVALDSAKARLLAQQSRVDQQKALYHLRQTQAQSLRVRAGITGVLQLVPVEEGQNVAVGTNVARAADPRKLKAEIKVAGTQAKDIREMQKAPIDRRNDVVTGHVSRQNPSVVNGTLTVDGTVHRP